MSTRSLIAVANPDMTYDTIYCHFDGYVKGGVGEELFKTYKERWKVENLISLGNRRTLGYEESEDELYNESYKKYHSLVALRRQLFNMIDYIYLFNLNDEWEVISDCFDGSDKIQTRKLVDMFL